MKKLLVLLVVVFASSKVYDAHAASMITVPVAGYCLRASSSAGTITVTNTCNFIVQAKLRFSNGGNDVDTDFTVGYSWSEYRPGQSVKTFGCSDGIASASSTQFVEPSYFTSQYWCVRESNN